MDEFPEKIAALFRAYRDTFPDPEPSADFTPGIWRGIEARRSSNLFVRRMSQIFVTAAAAITLLIAAVLIPHYRNWQVYSASYVDVLSAEHSVDTAAYEALRPGGPEAPPR